MVDKENNDSDEFDSEIEEAAASLDADSSFSLRDDSTIKPSPSSLSDSDEKSEPVSSEPDKHDPIENIRVGQTKEGETLDFSDDTVDVSDKLEVLIPNVLDSAEATNAAADVAAKAASTLETSVDRLQERVDVLTEASTRSTYWVSDSSNPFRLYICLYGLSVGIENLSN